MLNSFTLDFTQSYFFIFIFIFPHCVTKLLTIANNDFLFWIIDWEFNSPWWRCQGSRKHGTASIIVILYPLSRRWGRGRRERKVLGKACSFLPLMKSTPGLKVILLIFSMCLTISVKRILKMPFLSKSKALCHQSL